MNTTNSIQQHKTIRAGCIDRPPCLDRNSLILSDLPFVFLQIQLISIFLLTQALHRFFFKHLGLPPIVSQLVAGILLSPEVYFGKVTLMKGIHFLLFPEITEEVWTTMASLGYIFYLFIISVKMDFSMIRKNGRKPFVFGVLVIKLSGIINGFISYAYARSTKLADNVALKADLSWTATFTTWTSFAVIAILLDDLKLLNSELGRLALSSSIASDVVGVLIIIYKKAREIFVPNQQETTQILKDLCGIIVVILYAIFILRPWLIRIIENTPRGRPVTKGYLLLAFTLMLMGAFITQTSTIFITIGVFIIGVAIPDGPPLGSTIVYKCESFFVGVLQPSFVTMMAMKANVFGVNVGNKLGYGHLFVTFTGYFIKVAICLACGYYYNMAIQDTLALAAIFSTKGILDIATYNLYTDSQVIQPTTFSLLILIATIVATVVPIITKWLYDPMRKYVGYEKRDVMHCKPDTSLRILACISRSENNSVIANLVCVSRISKENKIDMDVLHLINLVGRCQPIFISHDTQTKKASYIAYSEEVIWFMKHQTSSIKEGLSLHYYTAVSPTKAMHEDICTLALDNLTSLIILPFHRKLNADGSIEFEDHRQRTLNISVLERAPCSVGILIDRGLSKFRVQDISVDDETCQVAVIFIGGKDDQEAVSYARRMARGKRVNIVVIQLIDVGEDQCGLSFLDSLVLSEIKDSSNSNSNFNFMEVGVKEGADSVKTIKSIVTDFDLVILGRRYNEDCTQTSGLKDWGEVSELGILGDLLASLDVYCNTSVLVLQQQKQWSAKEKIN